ncbi:MAG: copper ion binding protein, partial [Chloroflexota bacterium]
MPNTKQISLPITGMTCANCVSTVERNLKKIDGVEIANVNLTTERATVEYDPGLAQLDGILKRVERAGYGIATGEADIVIQRLSDDNDARRLEKHLSEVSGVTDVLVNFTTERAKITYIPTLVNQSELRKAIKSAGFDALVTEGTNEDAEQLAREAEIENQKQLFIIGLVFTLPLFLLSMLRDFGVLGAWAFQPWVNWLMLVLATPVQFYVGWQYYVGAFKSLRNGSANMDVLIAMGSSAAYFYSIPVLLGLIPGHIYFETAA